MSIPNRASDAGPESMAHCQKCEASLRKRSTGACIACEGPCCDACGENADDGWWCHDCLEALTDRLMAELPAYFWAVELGAKL